MTAKAVQAYQSIPERRRISMWRYTKLLGRISTKEMRRRLNARSRCYPSRRRTVGTSRTDRYCAATFCSETGALLRRAVSLIRSLSNLSPCESNSTIVDRQSDPASYFRALVRDNMEVFDVNTLVPSLALQWTDFEGDMKHAVGILSDLSQARQMVRETQDIVRRMTKAVNSPNPINIFSDLRTHRERTIGLRNRLIEFARDSSKPKERYPVPRVTLNSLASEPTTRNRKRDRENA